MGNLFNLLVIESNPFHFRDHIWYLGAILQADGVRIFLAAEGVQGVAAQVLAEIKSDSHMNDAHDLYHMYQVFHQIFHGLLVDVRVNEFIEGVQAYHAAGLCQGFQLLVGQVPALVAESPAIGVSGDHRPACRVQEIPEGGVV